MSKLCAIENCGKPSRTRGWCLTHYQRWRLKGDPNKMLRTPNGEGRRYFREVVLAYEGDECLTWPYAKFPNGYALLGHRDGKETQIVSRLVCEHTHGPAPSPNLDAAHSCGRGHFACVTKRHISWKTRVENKADELIHGTRARGERIGNSKLTNDQVLAIKSLKGKFTHQAIADRFGVSRSRVTTILNGRSWQWLEAA